MFFKTWKMTRKLEDKLKSISTFYILVEIIKKLKQNAYLRNINQK